MDAAEFRRAAYALVERELREQSVSRLEISKEAVTCYRLLGERQLLVIAATGSLLQCADKLLPESAK